MVGAEREAGVTLLVKRREESQPTTERRFSKAFKLGIYTVDERVPQYAW